MTTIDYLSQIKDIDLRIRSLEGELHDSALQDDPEYMEELQARIKSDISKYKKLRIEIREQIQQLKDNKAVILLTEYYVRGRSWEQTAAALEMKSVKHVRECMHKRAIELFLKKYGKYYLSTP